MSVAVTLGRRRNGAGIQRQEITVIESVDRYVSSEQGSATLEGTEFDLDNAVMGPTGRPYREFRDRTAVLPRSGA